MRIGIGALDGQFAWVSDDSRGYAHCHLRKPRTSCPLIANIGGLATTNLNGQWQAIVDPYEVGFLDYRAYPLKDNNAFFKNYKPKSKSELVEI
jgi:hypothetical protein